MGEIRKNRRGAGLYLFPFFVLKKFPYCYINIVNSKGEREMGWLEWGIYILVIVVFVIIGCIKERVNIIDGLAEFFGEWWQIIKTVSIPLLIIIILIFGWFGT